MSARNYVECEKCGAEVEDLTESVESTRGHKFCNGCVTALVDQVKAKTGMDLQDRFAVAALESELFGYGPLRDEYAERRAELLYGNGCDGRELGRERYAGGDWNRHGPTASR